MPAEPCPRHHRRHPSSRGADGSLTTRLPAARPTLPACRLAALGRSRLLPTPAARAVHGVWESRSTRCDVSGCLDGRRVSTPQANHTAPGKPGKAPSASRAAAGTPCFAARPIVIPSPRDLWRVVSFRLGFGRREGTKMCQHRGIVVEYVAHFVAMPAAPAKARGAVANAAYNLPPAEVSDCARRQHGTLIERFCFREEIGSLGCYVALAVRARTAEKRDMQGLMQSLSAQRTVNAVRTTCHWAAGPAAFATQQERCYPV